MCYSYNKKKTFSFCFLDEDDEANLAAFKEKLDKIMYEKTTNIENKRLFYVKKQQAAEAMEESSLKKMKQYNAGRISDFQSPNRLD